MYASRTRKEEFSGHDENCQQNASDIEGTVVTTSRPPGRPQKRPDDRTSNGGVAAQAADGSWRTAGAADERFCNSKNWRYGCFFSCLTVVSFLSGLGRVQRRRMFARRWSLYCSGVSRTPTTQSVSEEQFDLHEFRKQFLKYHYSVLGIETGHGHPS